MKAGTEEKSRITDMLLDALPYVIVAAAILISFIISGIRLPVKNMKTQGWSMDKVNEYVENGGIEPEIDMTVDINEARQIACDYLNEKYRIPLKVQPVELDDSLCKLADVRAKETYYKMEHLRADDTEIVDDIYEIGKKTVSVGENLIVMNVFTEEDFMLCGWHPDHTLEDQLKMHIDMYTASVEGHYENMVHPDNARYGIGVFYDAEHHLLYICDLFMS